VQKSGRAPAGEDARRGTSAHQDLPETGWNRVRRVLKLWQQRFVR
jgi:hypothetical protein